MSLLPPHIPCFIVPLFSLLVSVIFSCCLTTSRSSVLFFGEYSLKSISSSLHGLSISRLSCTLIVICRLLWVNSVLVIMDRILCKLFVLWGFGPNTELPDWYPWLLKCLLYPLEELFPEMKDHVFYWDFLWSCKGQYLIRWPNLSQLQNLGGSRR